MQLYKEGEIKKEKKTKSNWSVICLRKIEQNTQTIKS